MRCIADKHEASSSIRGYWLAVADFPAVDFVCLAGECLEERWQGTESVEEVGPVELCACQAVGVFGPCVGTEVLQLIAVFKVSIIELFRTLEDGVFSLATRIAEYVPLAIGVNVKCKATWTIVHQRCSDWIAQDFIGAYDKAHVCRAHLRQQALGGPEGFHAPLNGYRLQQR